ncbi:glycoside hydrolase family 3 protein [Microbacterium dauci]|uniref:Glycoside hydrolase family 3 N-terminal domain-containing protein n=1 Tax=Microbacterium dauci TaxID=3048008 RepID=A0ABT6ZAI5_9MICO|nr:glycoside hydrolase family 3 protein [Microbacterium sp. LX3-4]MDJ1113172.1 glycoside hydrolase family 3 N-terminal domain-containing protein [Microbacterium sp. LX3-4]
MAARDAMTPDLGSVLTLTASLTLTEKAGLLSGADVWQTRAVPRLGIRSLWMADGPHGLRKQRGDADHLGIGESEPATCFPTAATLACGWDLELAEQIGAALGREAAASGVDVLLGPGVNLVRDPRGGRSFEYFSEDPELAGRLGAAYVRGVQAQGVAATPKHFAVNSQETRRLTSDSVVDEQTLRELYLTAFEIVVREAAPWALMTAYNRVNGVYAHEHRDLLTRILREEWGFDGAVVSDWGGTDDPVASVRAGGTVQMPSPGWESVRRIVEAVQRGELSEADLDARVTEVLRLIDRTSNRGAAPIVDLDAHHQLARHAAATCAVLLRNEGGILPLSPDARVALVGAYAETPRYQGAGSSIVTPTRLTSLRSAAEGVTAFAPGYRIDGTTDAALLAAVTDAAASADVVVVALAVPAAHESEGIDRPHLRLPDGQLAALRAAAATGTPVVAVLAGGGPVETPWRHEVAALVHGHLGGQAGGEAIWDVLTGRVHPTGRLAVTMPAGELSPGFPATGRVARYDERLGVGYRSGRAAAFPFGFGLGYTSFELSDLEVTPDGAAVTVRNVGAAAGTEVVQLYIAREGRATPELKGFARVRVEPGAAERVELPFTARTFRRFERGAWRSLGGEWEVRVGRHSADLPLRAVLAIDGEDTPGGDTVTRAASEEGWRPPFDRNTPLDQLVHSPSPLVRLLVRAVLRRKARADLATEPDLDIQFIASAPLRTIHTMTAATSEVTNAVVRIANGAGLPAWGALLVALARGPLLERRTRRAFGAAR